MSTLEQEIIERLHHLGSFDDTVGELINARISRLDQPQPATDFWPFIVTQDNLPTVSILHLSLMRLKPSFIVSATAIFFLTKGFLARFGKPMCVPNWVIVFGPPSALTKLNKTTSL